MSSCDFDLLSVCDSLDGFPGQDNAFSPPDRTSLVADKALEDLESFQLCDRMRIAAIEASRTAVRSADRYPFEAVSQGDFETSPFELAYSGSSPITEDRVRETLSRDFDNFEAGFAALDSLLGPAAACPPTRPPSRALASSQSSISTPSLRPSSPSTCALDEDEFRALYPPRTPTRYLDGNELLSRFPPRADSTGNTLAIARYVPPALRVPWGRQRREQERRERREQKRRDRESEENAQDGMRVFYPTEVPGVFDIIPPSEQKTLKSMADEIAANCYNIAMSPKELESQMRCLDDEARRTIHRLTGLLRVNTPDCSAVKIVRILKCAIHASCGLDFKCVTDDGSVLWYRDVNMRLDDPESQELVYRYLSDPRRTFSQEQIRMLRTLPQYRHEEGRRIFVPMMRRALPEKIRRARAYV
ncbi:hypothetical protein AURDEDRAFT_172878 [Auricularia subglabra TFB-10046 SS5]|uniref:Uncharacterized protein n=1 Tax=Auricularia subglabra (strain TFB-10046 / SS5) TaxID=717982 RepID=J0D113_AURST|nr:hypothetical protein AURDEDRAFT_172878 [Auricularia subglabra TFB-10046 SS5]